LHRRPERAEGWDDRWRFLKNRRYWRQDNHARNSLDGLRINLDGPFICCKAIVPSMVKQNYGRIVAPGRNFDTRRLG
jgi:hypothetical protein